MKPERPRLLVFNHCRQFIYTMAVLSSDEIDMDDVDSAAEDHVGEVGICPWDERKNPVPQPLVTSLSLRNTRLFGIMNT